MEIRRGERRGRRGEGIYKRVRVGDQRRGGSERREGGGALSGARRD